MKKDKKIGAGLVPESIPNYSGYYNYEWCEIDGKAYCYETGQMVDKKPESATKIVRPDCD